LSSPKNDDFTQFSNKNNQQLNKEKTKPGLKLVPPARKGRLVSEPTPSLTQLLSTFQEQKETMMRWLGLKTYPTAAQEQKKAGKIRKGIIIDKKVT
jgi:hypothetical protein